MKGVDKIELFKTKCIEDFNDKLQCLVLTGSYARGDYNSMSDIDIWIILETVSKAELLSISDIINSEKEGPEINPQCVSGNELLTKVFAREFNPIQIYVDGKVLYGKLPQYLPYCSEVKTYMAQITAQVLMSSRHYISVGEPEESLAKGKVFKWVLKPLSWVLRYKVYLNNSDYPRSINELIGGLSDEDETRLMIIYSDILNGSFNGSAKELNILCMNTAQKILNN